MPSQWPPSPCVEDEHVSLAKELGAGLAAHGRKNDDVAGTRGAVDQYPIILDNSSPEQGPSKKVPRASKPCELVPDNGSSDERQEAVTPPTVVNHEKRYVHIPSEIPPKDTPDRRDGLHRSKSTTQLREQDASRGRPQIARLRTDLPADLNGMVTGNRRAPSPYSYSHKSSINAPSAHPNSKSSTLLSPLHAEEPRRPLSAHPRARQPAADSSDSEGYSKAKRRPERSRSRAPRQSFSHSDRSEGERVRFSKSTTRKPSPERAERPTRSERRPNVSPKREYSRRPSPGRRYNSSPERERRSSPKRQRSRRRRQRSPQEQPSTATSVQPQQEHMTPPQTPKPAEESRPPMTEPPVSARREVPKYTLKKAVVDSPYTSSAEETQNRRHGSGDERRRARSRRASRSQPDKDSRPHLDFSQTSRQEQTSKESRPDGYESDNRPRQEAQTPMSARTPKSMEDYFEKAFQANQSRKPTTGYQSRTASPLTSPPQSPPHTPRGDRGPREDYFEPPPSKPSRESKDRSRPTSVQEHDMKDFKLSTLLGAAMIGAATKAIPSLSRSSTSQSMETPSSGSQSRISSGQRSRKPTPVIDDSHIGSHPGPRSTSTVQREDEPNTRTTTYHIHDDRLQSKLPPQTPTLNAEPPRFTTRASSYSSSPETSRPQIAYRALSNNIAQASLSLSPLHFVPGQNQPVPPPALARQSSVASFASIPQTWASSLPQCPRFRPQTGYYDWYTIRDMPHLDFCPSCMQFFGSTRFRDYFAPSLSKDPNRPTMCAMSMPWIRFVWLQILRQSKPDLKLLWAITTPPPEGTKPCAGSKSDLRRWYHLIDPRTEREVENFDLCSACVRNIDTVFPELRRSDIFDRPDAKLSSEKICNLNTSSRHFFPILGELDKMAQWKRKNELKTKDISNFVEYIRRICRNRECQKDSMLAAQAWHFHPDLPELTICAECFDEVIWPVKDRPIARDVSKSMKVVPVLLRTQLVPGISCQLYSERMRRIFYDAVNRNDFASLREAARQRYAIEHRLQESQKYLEADRRRGIERSAEMQKNSAIWKSYE